ncbi:MAG: flagellar basal body protein, partial [Paracoccaceae bacterium]
MASLFEIGKSAVNAQRQALNVTGQNIANVNTDGYRKRDASLKEVSGSQSELTSIAAQVGLGVSLGTVRRAYNSFLASSTNMAESRFQSATEFSAAMERLENLILPGEGDLSQQLSDFFSKMSDIAANPGDLAPRAA